MIIKKYVLKMDKYIRKSFYIFLAVLITFQIYSSKIRTKISTHELQLPYIQFYIPNGDVDLNKLLKFVFCDEKNQNINNFTVYRQTISMQEVINKCSKNVNLIELILYTKDIKELRVQLYSQLRVYNKKLEQPQLVLLGYKNNIIFRYPFYTEYRNCSNWSIEQIEKIMSITKLTKIFWGYLTENIKVLNKCESYDGFYNWHISYGGENKQDLTQIQIWNIPPTEYVTTFIDYVSNESDYNDIIYNTIFILFIVSFFIMIFKGIRFF